MVSVALSSWRGGDDVRMRRELIERMEWECSLRSLGVNLDAWIVHFGFVLPGQVCCRDCVDFILGFCKGGGDPVKCMRDSLSETFP